MRSVLNASIVGVALFLCMPAIAQNGYIIVDSSYTTGYVENQGRKLNSKEVKFRKSVYAPSTTFYPGAVKEYGFDDNTYRSRKIAGGTDSSFHFLYVLSKGAVDLYTIKLNGKKRFFAGDKTNFVELKKENNAYQQEIARLFTACRNYEPYLDDVRFKEKSLKRFFALQNVCYDKGPWPVTRFVALAGYHSIDLTVENVYGEDVTFDKNNGAFFGVGMEFPFGTRPSWSFLLQLQFQQNNYKRTVDQITSSEQRVSQYTIETATVTVPALIKYSVPLKKMKAFVTLGPGVGYNLKNDARLLEEITRQGNTTINDDNSDIMSNLQVSGNAGAGLEYYLNQKISLGLEGRYIVGEGIGSGNHSYSGTQIAFVVSF